VGLVRPYLSLKAPVGAGLANTARGKPKCIGKTRLHNPDVILSIFLKDWNCTVSDYAFKLVSTASEVADYFALRRLIFVEEQKLFDTDDRDEIDQTAHPIVAIAPESQQVVGVVRIYQPEPRLWYGGRLGTHPDFRKGWQIGKGLIYKAVTTANTWGCDRFLATVQLQNVRFFQRLHWGSLEELSICDRPHHLMEADLNFYPPDFASLAPSQEVFHAGSPRRPTATVA
jgi:putative N-acetyltransferase (TIGR04045 family)